MTKRFSSKKILIDLYDAANEVVLTWGASSIRAIIITHTLAHLIEREMKVPGEIDIRGVKIPIIAKDNWVHKTEPFEICIMDKMGGLLDRKYLVKAATPMTRTRHKKWRTLRWSEAETGMRVRAAGGIFNVGMVGEIVDAKGEDVTVVYKGGQTQTFKFNKLQVDISSVKNPRKEISINETIQRAWKQYITDTGSGPKHGYLSVADFVTLKQEMEAMERKEAISVSALQKKNRPNFIISMPTDKGTIQITNHPTVPMQGSEILFSTKNLVDVRVDDWDEKVHGVRKYTLIKELGPVTVDEASKQLELLKQAVKERERKAPWNV